MSKQTTEYVTDSYGRRWAYIYNSDGILIRIKSVDR